MLLPYLLDRRGRSQDAHPGAARAGDLPGQRRRLRPPRRPGSAGPLDRCWPRTPSRSRPQTMTDEADPQLTEPTFLDASCDAMLERYPRAMTRPAATLRRDPRRVGAQRGPPRARAGRGHRRPRGRRAGRRARRHRRRRGARRRLARARRRRGRRARPRLRHLAAGAPSSSTAACATSRTGSVGIAYESAVERGVLMSRTAPHLVRALPMLIPLLPHASRAPGRGWRRPASAPATLLRIAARTSRRPCRAPRRAHADRDASRWPPACGATGCAAACCPGTASSRTTPGWSSRVARTAAAHGARILTRCRALELHRRRRRACATS